MLKGLEKHLSNITRSASEYLQQLSVSYKTRKLHEEVLWLFIQKLLSDSSSVIEGDDGEYLLNYDWDVYYGGVMESFVGWWLPRKVIFSNVLEARAPGVLRKWVRWCHKEGYFDRERLDEFLSGLPRGR